MGNINSNIKKSLIFVITAFIVCVPFTYASFDCNGYAGVASGPEQTNAILYMLCPIQSAIWLGLYFVGAVLIIMILYGGIKALMSTGDARQLEGAKLVWTYSILGALVILLAIFIVQIAFGLLGSTLNPLNIADNMGASFTEFMDALTR